MLHRLPLIRVRVERGRQRRPLSRLIIFQWWLLALIGSRLIVPPRSNCSASSSGRVTAIENGRPARSARSGIQDRSKEAAAEYARFRFHVERLALGNWVCSYAVIPSSSAIEFREFFWRKSFSDLQSQQRIDRDLTNDFCVCILPMNILCNDLYFPIQFYRAYLRI